MNRQTVRRRCMPVYALYAQRKSPMRTNVHIRHLGTPALSGTAVNWVLCVTPCPVFLPSIFRILSIKGVMLDTLPLRPPLRFAVLPNPVPDRQPCSALCRVAFLGLLVQTEVMTGFPKKYLIGRSFTFTPDADTPGVQRSAYK